MNKRAFTLVEMAIVLIIIGVLVAGGVKMINSAMNSSKYTSTRNQIEGIVREIAEYSARAKYIPSDANIENIISPFTDNFGNRINYIPDPDLTKPYSGTAEGGICNAGSTDLTVLVCSDAACDTPDRTYTNVAFFVSSNSEDKAQAFTNTAGVIKTFTTSDDITGLLTLDALKKYAGCEGSGLTIIEDSIPQGAVYSSYKADLHPTGGMEDYSWCVTSDDAAVRGNLLFNGFPVLTTCADGDYKTGNTKVAITSSEALNPDDNYPASSKLTVYLKDSDNQSTQKTYTLKILQSYEIVLNRDANDDGETETIVDFDGFATANIDDFGSPESGIVGTDYNSDIVREVEGGNVTMETLGSRNGSACVWWRGIDGLKFTGGYLVVYFEWRLTEISSDFNGFTFAMIKNIRPNLYGDDPTTEEDDASSEDDCGDVGSGMGYSYTNPFDTSSYALYGNGFALEFDPDEDIDKNDPWLFKHQGSNNASGKYDHIGIVSAKYNAAYNVHDLLTNDICIMLTGTGCYFQQYMLNKNETNSVRVEAYHGCNFNGSVCDGSEGNNYVCVYAWVDYPTNPELKDMTQGFIYNNDLSTVGQPTVKDCYDIPAGTLDRVRPGFTFSNEGTKSELQLYNFQLQRIEY